MLRALRIGSTSSPWGQRRCQTKPSTQDIDYSKHPAYKRYTLLESAEIMMQEPDKPPTLVHRCVKLVHPLTIAASHHPQMGLAFLALFGFPHTCRHCVLGIRICGARTYC